MAPWCTPFFTVGHFTSFRKILIPIAGHSLEGRKHLQRLVCRVVSRAHKRPPPVVLSYGSDRRLPQGVALCRRGWGRLYLGRSFWINIHFRDRSCGYAGRKDTKPEKASQDRKEACELTRPCSSLGIKSSYPKYFHANLFAHAGLTSLKSYQHNEPPTTVCLAALTRTEGCIIRGICATVNGTPEHKNKRKDQNKVVMS